ncbi:MAG TPA: GNAT family N-acetyltransferase [Alphaproteobacteria bacterium]|nr:GNAT family N-acetyltransferase [Alphaproteobacteria bacterium]
MNKRKVTFSTDTKVISIQDLYETVRMAEKYFKTISSNDQIRTDDPDDKWYLQNALDYTNIIKYKDKVVGYTMFLPCTKQVMNYFLDNRISEKGLYAEIQKEPAKNPPEAIYCCATIVKKKYRRNGLGTAAGIKLIEKFSRLEPKPAFFCDLYSNAGRKLVENMKMHNKLENILVRG